ncbi:TonB-dependent receptor [Fodinibius sediminis]|uniref:Outer membrane receptor for ferrienterochelin and colicins n=1 Tax=Fodinibius sediminis TaxID=1214077 RepID=A0A521C6D3_9BACT|nr:TonB-dependent receptor [Fodinibius sediminis]SMO54925.1 outer membrane receptor for ferrienterochelin and colicins [Fodinibius sediminis]
MAILPVILFISLTFFPQSLSAQEQNGEIRGVVIDDGTPINGVNVALQNIQRGTTTDSSGIFLIDNIKPGSYTLVVSTVGYHTHRQLVTIRAGEERRLQIPLKPKIEKLGEVVVTGTMRETFVKDSPVKVSVISPRRLEQGRMSSNIMDLIDQVNGLSTQLNCGVCGTNAIRINGVEGPNTAVLIDGMPVMGALASVYGLNGISPSIIDQVEVIKGPQSTLYGTQALGGVVNIITKDPANTPSLVSDVYAKSTSETNINLAASPKTDRFKSFISGNILRMERFRDKNADLFNDTAKRSRFSFFGKGTLLGSNGSERMNVAAKIYDENRTGGVRAYSDDLRGSNEIYGESIDTRRFELLGNYFPAGLDQNLRISSAITHHHQDSYYGPTPYVATQRIAFGQATWTQPLSELMVLLAGATARYEYYNDNTPATARGPDRRLIPGIFSQAEVTLKTLTLLGGIRLDHHSEHGFVTAPRLSLKYRPGAYTTLRMATGTGFRVVNVFTEDHAALTGSREVVFSENLEPERSHSITVSLEHIFRLDSNPLTLTLDGFYTRFSNKIIPDYDQDPNLIVYENLDGFSVSRGFSVDLDQNFTLFPLSYNASFTLMNVFTKEDSRRQALAYAPKYIGAFGASYNIKAVKLSIGYSGSLVGSKRMPDSYVKGFGRDRWSPAYTTHDIKLTREFANVNNARGLGFEAYLSVENLFNYTQGSPLVGADAPFGPQFDTIYSWGPMVGRTFAAGMRLNLR